MIAKWNLQFATLALLSLLTLGAHATPLQNGDFSAGLDNWNNAGAGDATVEGGAAVLQTLMGNLADPFSAILVQGDDGSFSFASAFALPSDTISLQFDVRRLVFFDGQEAGGSLFEDALTVAVYDALGIGTTDLLFTSGTDFAVSTDFQQVTLDVASLAGRAVALSFELFDESDGLDSRFILDNVAFVQRIVGTVPVPSSLMLTGLAVALLWSRRRLRAVN